MAKRSFSVSRSTGKRAVAYLRKSTDQQEASIPGQKTAVYEYAQKHGFAIVGEYIDAGISGVDSIGDRKEFARLVSDAELGTFEYVIAWDLSRITRSDPMETFAELRPLRKAGVRIVLTDRTEPIDWDSFAGMLTLSIEAESNNQYVRKLARGTTRGQRDLAREGKWVAGRPPLGYKVGPDRRLELGNPKEIEAVRYAFKAYANGGSLRSVQAGLRSRGFEYVVSTVRFILRNPLYIGDFVWNRNTQAKFYSVRGGDVCGDFEKGATSSEDQIIVVDSHEPIIDRVLFEQVQSMFEGRKKLTTPLKDGGEFILSGLLRCADCGAGMIGTRTPKKEGKSIFYRCVTSQTRGVHVCHPHNTMQDAVLKAIFETLNQRYGNDDTIKRLRKEFEDKAKSQASNIDAKAIERTLKLERSKLEKASRRLVEVDADLIEDVQKQVREIKKQVASLESELKLASTSVAESLAQFDERAKKAIELFKQFKTIYKLADPILVRSFLQTVIDHVKVTTSRSPAGTRWKYKFEGGELVLKQDASLFCEGSRPKQVCLAIALVVS